MPHDSFRVAIVVSPKRLVDLGVLAGDYSQACQWILEKRPIIDEFLARLKADSSSAPVEDNRKVTTA
jgi:hypothetical protein